MFRKSKSFENQHGDKLTRSSDEINCVLKVNVTEVFPDQDDVD